MKNLTVLFHQDNDGWAAAYAVWKKFGDAATYIPVQYSQPVPEIPAGTNMLYIVDFSYSREICEDLAKKYDLMIYDHHNTAEKNLAGLPYAVFNKNLSGCGLTWQALHDTPMPAILSYVQDYDLWQFKLPQSEIVNLYISTLPWDFNAWDSEASDDPDMFIVNAIEAGRAIYNFRQKQIDQTLQNVRMMQFKCTSVERPKPEVWTVPVVNCSANVSEVGNVLCAEYPDAPFSASYCDRKDLRSWSLRSVGEFDVSRVAKMFGGGGHKNAAGFSVEIGWPQYHGDEFIKAFEEATK